MPKIAGKVLATKIDQGRMLAKIQLNRKLPPVGTSVIVKWGATRSNSQNAFYWAYLTFLWEDCNLKEEYLTIEELHETLKATFLSEKLIKKQEIEIVKVGSTTTLDKVSFGEYLDKVDKAMVIYYNINTSQFWKDYAENYEL